MKIYAYFYRVGNSPGHHWFLVIVDNVASSPTYGQRWYVSGYPDGDGIGIDETLLAEIEDPGGKRPYDMGHRIDGGVVLVNDATPADPWVRQASKAVSAIGNAAGSKTGSYSLVNGNNSNTVFFFVLNALGLTGQFDSALAKRTGEGHTNPWSPGIGMPRGLHIPDSPKPFPRYRPGRKFAPRRLMDDP